MTAELHVLLIGDADYAEFRAAVAALAGAGAGAVRVHPATDLAAAVELVAGGLRPEVIIIAQQRPGEIAPEDVEQLRRLAPLAPCIAIQSSWCESEARTGRPLPGVVRMPWRRFASEIVPGLLRLRSGQLPDWAGPATLTPEERLLQRSAETLPRGRGTVGIWSHSYESRRLLADLCRSVGWSVVTLPASWTSPFGAADGAVAASLAGAQPGACDVVVCDFDELPDGVAPALGRLRESVGGAEVILLMSFPREHDVEPAAAAGAAGVVAKPFTASELLGEIDRAASRGGSVSR